MWGACQYHVGFSIAEALGNKLVNAVADAYEPAVKQLLKATAKVAFEHGFTMAMVFKGSAAYMKAELGVREMSTLSGEEILAIYRKVSDAAWLTIEDKFDFAEVNP